MPEKKHACERCPLRRHAEGRPNSLIARVWRWHTGWCPGWKAYMKYRTDLNTKSGDTPP